MTTIAGLVLFLHGLSTWSHALQKGASRRFREWISAWTKSALRGATFGAAAAFLSTSSAAVAVLAVTLAGAGILRLPQALCILAGAGTGTALTVQLLAFRVADAAPLLMAAGLVLRLVGRHRRWAIVGDLLLSCGILFFGLGLMGQGIAEARDSLTRAGAGLLASPWTACAVAAILTVALQGSTATMGLAIVALQQGLPGIPAASWVGYVAGANVGTSSTAFLAAGGGDRRGLQVAVAYLAVKLLVALPIVSFAGPIADASGALDGPGGAHRLALMHLAFNVAVVSLTLPLSGFLSRVVGSLVPHRGEPSEPLGTRYLTEAALETRDGALAQAHLELVRMAELVAQMVRAVPDVVRAQTPAPIDQVRRMDDRVDLEQAGLTRFLSRLSQRHGGGGAGETVAQAMSIADDLENIGDVITKQVAALAEKRLRQAAHFSDEGLSEILGYHAAVGEVFASTLEALRGADRAKASELAARREDLAAREGVLRRSHIERVLSGRAESLDTSAIHLDLLYAIRRIHAHAMNVNLALVGRGEP